jgi:CO dehydrogenase maturation factor
VRELTAAVAESDQEHVVLDMEAGVEHLSRGTTRNTNVLLVVAEPYYKSLETAARVVQLGVELGIAQVLTVVNKVRPQDEQSISEFVSRHGLNVVASIAYDESVLEADRRGIAPIDHEASGAMVTTVAELTAKLLDA